MFDRESTHAYFFHYRFHYLWQDWGRLVNQVVPTMNTHRYMLQQLRVSSSVQSKLTEGVHTRQKFGEMAKSWILVKLGWGDQLVGGADHTKYFWPRVTLMVVAAHPNFEVTKKN